MANKEQRICIDCSNPYEPQYWEALGAKILRGAGRCPECSKRAFEEQEAKERAARTADITRRRRDARGNMGIPPRFMNEDFSSFKKRGTDEIDDACKKCWNYAEDYPIGEMPKGYVSLYIYSVKSWGVGKSHLSCSIAHRILDRWQGEERLPRIKWISEPDLFQRIQASYNYTYEEKQLLPNADDIIKELVYVDLLIIDDVGKEERQDPRFVQRILFAIINGRYDRNVPLIITANLDASSLMRHLGGEDNKASFDRFMEMCKGKSVKMDGESYRKVLAKGV